jgi:hypothetical protein
MSLINDALKKAQKQRTGDSPPLAAMPGVGGESAAKIAKRGKPADFNTQLKRLAMGAGGVLVIVIAGGYFVLRASHRRPAEPSQKPASTEAVQNPATLPASDSKLPASSPQVTFTLPIAPPAAPVSSITSTADSESIPTHSTEVPAVQTPAPASPAPTKPIEAKPALLVDANSSAGQTPVGPPHPTVKLDSKSINFIENLHIAGIRASATDSKVLMNDRVYRIGDIVEHNLGLKLTGITASSLTFEDENGGRYTRNF